MTASDLDRSVNFYCDVFSCQVAVHEQDTALLLTSDGFQIYLHSKGPFGGHVSAPPASNTSCGPPTARPSCSGYRGVCAPTMRQPTHTPRTG